MDRGGNVNFLKVTGGSLIVAARISNQEWIQIIAIIIMVLGMIQDYLEARKQ